MIRLCLTVEGQTEAAFANDVLAPHLLKFDVFLTGTRFTGLHQRKGGRIPRGGLLGTFSHALKDMQNWMKEDKKPDARFSMMVDLYSLPTDFPGYETGMKFQKGRDQAVSLQKSLAEFVADSRFIPYLQSHEFEALVLVDPQKISQLYEVAHTHLDELIEECKSYQTPEDINHGKQSHPKYRIKDKIINYDENVAGPLLTQQIGLESLREKCPHFHEWLSRLESLNK